MNSSAQKTGARTSGQTMLSTPADPVGSTTAKAIVKSNDTAKTIGPPNTHRIKTGRSRVIPAKRANTGPKTTR